MLKGMISSIATGLASGGTVDGDLVVTGDFKVEGAGSFTYDEIIEGTLHVKKSSSGATAHTSADDLVVESSGDVGISLLSGASDNCLIHFGDSGDSNIGFLDYDHADNSLDIGVNAATRMTITSTGAVGIGGTPSTSLHVVNGHFRLNNSYQIQFGGSATHIDGDSGYMAIDVNDAERIRIDSSGRVGIGTTSPQAKFVIAGSTDSWDGMAKMYLYDSNSNSNSRNWAVGNGGTGYGQLSFVVSNTKDGQPDDAGTAVAVMDGVNKYMGIGTLSPSAKLEINGGGYTNSLIIRGSASHSGIRFKDSDGNTDGYVYADTSNVGFLDADGDWAIRASANTDARLYVGNSLKFIVDTNSRISLSNNDSGTSNTVFGKSIGTIDAGTNYNTFFGEGIVAGGTLDNASENTGLGWYSLRNLTTGDGNTAVGSTAMEMNTTGGSNVAIGKISGRYNQTGSSNVSLGYGSLRGVSGNSHSQNTAIGTSSMLSVTTGGSNSALGENSLYSITTGANNVALGKSNSFDLTTGGKNVSIGGNAGKSNQTGNFNVGVGYQAMQGVSGNSHSNNTAAGYQSLYAITTGDSNVAVGYQSAKDLTTGANNVLLGTQAGDNASTLGNSIGIGYQSLGGANSTLLTGANATIAIGHQALGNLSGNAGNGVYIGYLAGKDDINGGNVAVGYRAMETSQGTGMTKNTAIGTLAQQNISFNDSGNNTSLGYNALKGGSVTGAVKNNVAIGMGALEDATSTYGNVAIGGRSALAGLTSGNSNIAIGDGAGQTMTTTTSCILIGSSAGNVINSTDANGTVAIGHSALVALTDGQKNTAIGFEALKNENDGDFNTAVGYQALQNQEGRSGTVNNTAVGHRAGASMTNGYESTFIGSNAGAANTTGAGNTIIGANTADSLTTGDFNTALGTGALNSEDVGRGTTALGYQALYKQNSNTNDEDTNNLGVGFHAGYNIIEGVACTFVGSRSGVGASGVDIGNFNTGLGSYSLNAIKSGTGNTGLGTNAGLSLTTGGSNTLIGYNSGRTATNLSNLIAIGDSALYNVNSTDANSSVAIGVSALSALTSGQYNTATGYEAGKSITTGDKNTLYGYRAGGGANGIDTLSENTFIGYNTGLKIDSGTRNTAIGSQAMESSAADSDANDNVAIGKNAMYSLSDGDNSVSIGNYSGEGLTVGGNNVLLGHYAGNAMVEDRQCIAIGFQALMNGNGGGSDGVPTDTNNTAIGANAGNTITNGVNNVLLGSGADVSTSGAVNQIVIGKSATGQENNSAVIGGSAITKIYMAQDANASGSSQAEGAEILAKSGYFKRIGLDGSLSGGSATSDNPILTLHGAYNQDVLGSNGHSIKFIMQDESTNSAETARIATVSRSGAMSSNLSTFSTDLEFWNRVGGTMTKQMIIRGGDDRAHVIIEGNNNGSGGGVALIVNNDGNDANRDGIQITAGADDASGTTAYIDAQDGNGDQVGHISNTSGTFALTDVSDKRLKKNIVDTSVKGVETIEKMKVRDFEWIKSGDKMTAGFVAQELAEAFPSAVTGEDGAMEDIFDKDGNKTGEKIKPMGVSRDVLVPVLIKAVQELSARVKELEGK